ncbi:hypothetical protein [Histophilus somni]|uniref:hypothetical protein n=1 Tax=Histophilus somni TaxID=731 RepID=UPI003877D5CF
MRITLFIIALILSGCYLANGSPNSSNFWKKVYGTYNIGDWKHCQRESYDKLNSTQRELLDKGDKNWEEVYSNQDEYKLYKEYIDLEDTYFSDCLYTLGYRFRPPLSWCLAQDGNNTKICINNMKYRN